MLGSAQAGTSSADYDLAMTIIHQWDIYRTGVIAATILLLILTLIFMLRKNWWALWLLLLTLIAGVSIFVLDGFKVYVAKRKTTVIRETVLAPVTNTVGRVFKGVFGVGQ